MAGQTQKNREIRALGIYGGSPDVSEVKLYVDGTAESITYIDAQPINTVSGIDLWIGTYDGVIFQFAGLIDEVAIYDEALSQAEILWLYTNNQ